MAKLPQTEEDMQQFLGDLLILASIPNESISDFATRLEGQKSFFQFKPFLREHIPSADAADAIGRLVINLEPESLPAVEDMLDSWRKELNDPQLLDDQSLEMLKQKLETLTQPTIRSIVRRLRKANDLMTATGNGITALTFICDARPVYNDDRTDINGFVPLATMKLFYDDPNGEQEVLELTMTPDDLDSIIERATNAREKLNVMQKKFSEFLPNGTGRIVV